MAAIPTWEETAPLFDETQPVENAGPDIIDLLKQGASSAMDVAGNTPMGQVSKFGSTLQKGLDTGADKLRQLETVAGVPEVTTQTDPMISATQHAPDIAMMTMGGGAAPKVAEEASPMASKLSTMATDARMRGFRVPGSAIDQTGELQSMRGSVETLKGQGIEPKVFETAEDLGNRVKSGISEFGQAVRDIPKKLDQYGIKPRLNNETLPMHLEAELQPRYVGGINDTQAAIAKEIAETAKGHSDSFQGLLDLKQQLGEQGKFYRVNTGEPGAPLKAEMYQKAYGKISEIIKNEINAVAPEFSDAWSQANEIYSAGKDVLPHLTKAAGKSAATDITGFDLQRPLASMKPPVNAAIAYGADKASRLMQAGSNALGQFGGILKNAAAQGPKAFAVTHYTLSQKSPEYRQMLEEGEDNENQ